MSITLTESPDLPQEERRGGDEGVDWGEVRPGQPFPTPGKEVPDDRCSDDRDAAPLLSWCGMPGCGGD